MAQVKYYDTGSGQWIAAANGGPGSQGIQGTQGLIGLQGALGTQGIQGVQGLTGSQGVQGLQGPATSSRVTSITDSTTPTPNADTTDIYIITALASAPTFGSPTGSPINGQKLMIRVKDNGTARTLAWNAVYRASADLALPTTTVVSKTLYMGFIYNTTDTKWDLIASLGNF